MNNEMSLSSDKEYVEEDEDIRNLKLINLRLKQENENYKQKLYELQRKLQASEAVQKELQDTNESLEQLLSQQNVETEQKIRNIEIKYRAIEMEYKDRLTDLEFEIMQKTKKNEELQNQFMECKKMLKETKPVEAISLEDHIMPLKCQIEELTNLLQIEEQKEQSFEETIKDLLNQNSELQDLLQVTKEQLKEKTETLEQTRDELVARRAEIDSLKTIPASDSRKGNSLFAEVEDRRQALLDKCNILHKKYNELKRTFNEKVAEIDMLKAEKTTLINRWESDTNDAFDAYAQLTQSYKNRITELENKLKAKKKSKSEDSKAQCVDDEFSYVQSLLATKNKEIEELEKKIEDHSINMLIQEEGKQELRKQLLCWKSKVMNMKTQLYSLKHKVELSSVNGEVIQHEVILKLLENCIHDTESDTIHKFSDYGILELEKKMDNLNTQAPLKSFKAVKNDSETKSIQSSTSCDLKAKGEGHTEASKVSMKHSFTETKNTFSNENYSTSNAAESSFKTICTKPCLKSKSRDIEEKISTETMLRFIEGTKDTHGDKLKKQGKKQEYPSLFFQSEEN